MSALLKLTRKFNQSIKCSYCIQNRLQQTARPQPEPELKYQENVPVFRNAASYAEKIALKDTRGNYTYGNIFISANHLSRDISKAVGGKTNERILFLCPNDAHYVITQWAIWLSGQIGAYFVYNVVLMQLLVNLRNTCSKQVENRVAKFRARWRKRQVERPSGAKCKKIGQNEGEIKIMFSANVSKRRRWINKKNVVSFNSDLKTTFDKGFGFCRVW